MALSDQTNPQTVSSNGNKPLSETLCPLCAGDNQCAVAAGQDPETCWCQKAEISKESLAAVPKEAVNKVCICPACGQAMEEPNNEG